METIHLNDYLAVLKRRRKQILRVAASVFGIAVVLAAVLPTVYRSTAKLLIEQEVASDIVPSTVTGYVSQRIRVIQTRVLTSERLAQVAQKLDLYPSELKAGKTELVAERMRRNIVIESESAHVTDPKSGVSGMATVALNVSYESSDPQTAQKVAQELAALFIEENRAVRTQKAQRTTGFLGEEEARLREHIDDLEKQLAAYKEKNRGRLPELMNLNMQRSVRKRTWKKPSGRSIRWKSESCNYSRSWRSSNRTAAIARAVACAKSRHSTW
jgi:polysaccharide biosynthesis transport protein